MHVPEKKWDWEFGSKVNYWNDGIGTLMQYRHLLVSLVRRDFILNYQQTLLGPLWILFQPLLTLVTYVFVFGKLIGVSSGRIPPVLFYFSGIVLWNFFNESFLGTSRTFRDNIYLFSKVYFPRIIMPLAVISTQFLRFCIQMLLLLLMLAYFVTFRNFYIHVNILLVALPLVVLCTGCISLSLGLIFSVITAKYRDFVNVIEICIRLLIFITPVIYPLSLVRSDLKWIVQLNPLTPLFELFRSGLLGEGTVTWPAVVYVLIFTLLTLLSAILLFNKQANKLIDVI